MTIDITVLSIQFVLVVLLWIALSVYGFSVGWWLLETTFFARGWRPAASSEWELADVQVRILTVDAAGVLKQTVESIPEAVDSVHVVAERPIEVEGATVHVVPDDFECDATNKGRAVEWARRHIGGDTEYVLYLDEDTIVTGLSGIPDADFVQFTEKPIYTGSRMSYLCEVFRTGYQFEQFGFHRLRYPLYAWGGGFAVRRSIEEAVTWDVPTVTEDTNFIWRAARKRSIDYQLVDARFRNQAPPSLWAMVKQRRRWMSGTLRDADILPAWYRPIYGTRIVAWAFSPFVPVLLIVAYFLPGSVSGIHAYTWVATALLSILFLYMAAGALAYRKHPALWPVYLLLTPVAVFLHSLGAIWGVLRPAEVFEVTEKVEPEILEELNEGLAEGDLDEHDGTERLVRDSPEDFDRSLFTD
ncbi:MAG: glycosyltransferase family 2 protein [Halodesulfurarchaeum sp.]